MTLICFASQKGSPGATATTLAVAAALKVTPGRRKLLLEADTTGGTLAIRYRLPTEPGLLTLAAAVRSGMEADELWRHAQELPGGLPVVVCPDGPEQVNAAMAASGAQLGRFLSGLRDVDVICDVGRLAPNSPSLDFVAEASALLMVARPSAEQLQPAARRMMMLRPHVNNLGWVLIGQKPYGPVDVEQTFKFPVVGVIADDARSVTSLENGVVSKRLRRHPFIRSSATLARTLSDWLAPLTVPKDDKPGSAEAEAVQERPDGATVPPTPPAESEHAVPSSEPVVSAATSAESEHAPPPPDQPGSSVAVPPPSAAIPEFRPTHDASEVVAPRSVPVEPGAGPAAEDVVVTAPPPTAEPPVQTPPGSAAAASPVPPAPTPPAAVPPAPTPPAAVPPAPAPPTPLRSAERPPEPPGTAITDAPGPGRPPEVSPASGSDPATGSDPDPSPDADPGGVSADWLPPTRAAEAADDPSSQPQAGDGVPADEFDDWDGREFVVTSDLREVFRPPANLGTAETAPETNGADGRSTPPLPPSADQSSPGEPTAQPPSPFPHEENDADRMAR